MTEWEQVRVREEYQQERVIQALRERGYTVEERWLDNRLVVQYGAFSVLVSMTEARYVAVPKAITEKVDRMFRENGAPVPPCAPGETGAP